ncbi:MAG: acetyl-CoA hydrolase/transferase family protein [Frankiaceae bacterium]
MDWQSRVRWVSAAEAVGCVESGQRVFVQGASATPHVLIDALVARGPELSDVEIVQMHTNGPAPHTEPEQAGHFFHRAFFVGPNTRDAISEGRASYVPIFLSDMPRLFSSGRTPVDVTMLHVSPPDQHGYCSMGTSVDVALAAAQHSKIRIAQVNPQMPRTLGDGFIHIRDIDYAVRVDVPLPEKVPPPPGETELAIGRNVAELVCDGAVLQLGIGGIPNAVLAALGDRKDLGVHTEVVSDGILDLVRRGVLTGARKTLNRGKIVTAFLDGTRALYDFVDNNPMVEMRPADYTNAAHVIMRLDNMTAINSCLEIDLTGQVCAESIGTRMFSGVGGQMDFLRGAAMAEGGRPIIATTSTAKHGALSRIVPTLTLGAGVTTTRAHVHYVVTEFGTVNLHGLDLAERAQALISVAHPSFREPLTLAARELALLR